MLKLLLRAAKATAKTLSTRPSRSCCLKSLQLGRTEQSVQHLIFQRDLPVVRMGRRVHLHRRDLDAWIEKNKY